MVLAPGVPASLSVLCPSGCVAYFNISPNSTPSLPAPWRHLSLEYSQVYLHHFCYFHDQRYSLSLCSQLLGGPFFLEDTGILLCGVCTQKMALVKIQPMISTSHANAERWGSHHHTTQQESSKISLNILPDISEICTQRLMSFLVYLSPQFSY